MVAATARRHGVSPSLAVAVAYHESGFQQRVVSGVNAIGVMQVLPSTGRVLRQQSGRHLDLLDTQDNVTAGVLLLRQLVRSDGHAPTGRSPATTRGSGRSRIRACCPRRQLHQQHHVLRARFRTADPPSRAAPLRAPVTGASRRT